MKPDNREIEQRIAKLQADYFRALPDRLLELQQIWQQVKDEPELQHISQLRHIVHSLAGSGATFGLAKLSTLARKVEDGINILLNENRLPSVQEIDSQDELLGAIETLIRQSHSKPDSTELVLPVTNNEKYLLYVVEDDKFSADRLGIELLREKYEVETFTSLAEFKEAFHHQVPAGVIMDIMFPENPDGGLDVIDELRNLYDPMPPVIYISIRNDIHARLAAVKNGATRYVTKPFDYGQLVATMDNLVKRVPQQPYRVLVIDDDELLADYYATLLNGAGMETHVINQPLQVLDTLTEFKPDLILMDVYMPECSGLELAAVIRQDDYFVSLPIVYLSTEADINKQLYAMDLGGDDFLTKPVQSSHLISAVTVRVKRARRLARLRGDLELALQENRRQHRELEKKEERLRYSQLFANIGTWDLDIDNSTMFWSDRIGPLLGLRGEFQGAHEVHYSDFLDAIHPDDQQSFRQAIYSCITEHRPFEIEHRVLQPDGSLCWILQRGDVIRNSDGKALRMLGVVMDTTQRKKLERDLATQKDLAEQANRAKSEFLSRMSHELRTPLNAVIGFAQLLEYDPNQPLTASQKDNTGEILRAGNHLMELIDEVLDLARIEAGKMKLRLEELELNDVLLECYSLISPLAEMSNITLQFELDDCEGIRVRADRTRLRQVMLNLISNAIKYNTENGSVRIQCDAFSLSRIRINVIDTGQGIPLERQSELFQAFSRLGAETSEVEGTGIGLMIARRIAELMGGELGFSSEINEGSVFWVELIRTDISGQLKHDTNNANQHDRLTGTGPKKNN